MSKPLTIEELKALQVGDWVWIVRIEPIDKRQSYYAIADNISRLLVRCSTGHISFDYSDYGIKWLAYKNKEFAEAEEYKMDYNPDGGWEVRKYIPAHYQPWFTADTREDAEARLIELRGEK